MGLMKQAITTTQQQPVDERVSVCGSDTLFRSRPLCSVYIKLLNVVVLLMVQAHTSQHPTIGSQVSYPMTASPRLVRPQFISQLTRQR